MYKFILCLLAAAVTPALATSSSTDLHLQRRDPAAYAAGLENFRQSLFKRAPQPLPQKKKNKKKKKKNKKKKNNNNNNST